MTSTRRSGRCSRRGDPLGGGVPVVTGTVPTVAASHGDLNAWWRVGVPLAAAIVRLLFRLRVAGIHHVPLDGPAILAFVHVSVLDEPCLAAEVAWRRRRASRFLVASEIFAQTVNGWFLRRYRQIPIRRGRQDAAALDAVVDAIGAGSVVAIAPEGTVNPAPGKLQQIRTGVARVALRRAPVIPAGVWGTQRRWPKGGSTSVLLATADGVLVRAADRSRGRRDRSGRPRSLRRRAPGGPRTNSSTRADWRVIPRERGDMDARSTPRRAIGRHASRVRVLY